MQIHELNNFIGTPGANDYFATDNGTDTSKISATNLYAPLNARIDNIIAGPAPSAEEIIDARIGASGVTYTSLGEAIRGQIDDLEENISQITSPTMVDWSEYATDDYPTGWRNAYYNSGTGQLSTSNYYLATVNKIAFPSNPLYIYAQAPTGYGIRISEFNASGEFVENYGSSSAESPTQLVRVKPKDGYTYGFTLGRFSGNSSTFNTDEFISTITITIIADTIAEIEETIDYMMLDNAYNWSDMGTETFPTGWRTGYYNSNTGDYASSLRYLCTLSGVSADANTAALIAEAPVGYGVRISEYDAAGIFIRNYGNSSDLLTRTVSVKATEGHIYKFNIGRFDDDSEDYNTSEFLSNATLNIKSTRGGGANKMSRTGEFEFFTVDVARPLAFGGEEIGTYTESIECVLRLPTTYSATDTPTRLILACHGASGYIDASSSKWYNSNWKAFMDALLNAGYAVFDANVLPSSTGTGQMGFAVGSPLYVNVLKNAYDYIQRNYNVYPEIFAHGTSMGGVGASAFVNAYPSLVLAESSFAGRDITQYIKAVMDGDYDADDTLAKAWGYTSTSALTADKWSHIVGSAPSLSLHKYSNGAVSFAPDRETSFNGWLAYYAEIQNHLQADTIGDYTAFRSVPYKAWDSWNDNVGKTKAKLILKKAFTYGGTAPYEVVVYDNATHTELSYGEVNDMIPQLIDWYKRWE